MSDRPFDQNLGGDPADPLDAGLPTPQTTTPPPVTTTPAPPPVPAAPPAAWDEVGDDEGESSTADVAKEQAASVGQDVKDSAGQVAQTAAQEARQVAGEAKSQVQSLLSQVRGDVTDQAHGQQQRAAQGLHGLAQEFDQLAQGNSEGSTMASGLVSQAAQRIDGVAGWLENRQPADMLEDVKRYARRNPGTFLAICGLVGLVGGRLTRSLREESSREQDQQGGTGYGYATGPGPTTYEYAPDAGVYAASTGVPTAYTTRDYPGDVDAVDELPVGDDLIAREDRL
ncbi:hypothetical protein [Ornithinimicrobium sufpigmenti]|uniref:hypothetical protein n=1 Tax=Ornithinimicrobium sufpigmenti TaxID=2508882 RepID=UPI0010356D9D|nr:MULTISPECIES: hypothetical protein [unclassified Ornithinimicrobium]